MFFFILYIDIYQDVQGVSSGALASKSYNPMVLLPQPEAFHQSEIFFKEVFTSEKQE